MPKEMTARISFSKEEVKEIIKQYVIDQGYDVQAAVVVKIEDVSMPGSIMCDEEIKDLTEISVSVGMPPKKTGGGMSA